MLDVRLAARSTTATAQPVELDGDAGTLRLRAGTLARSFPEGPVALDCRGLSGARLTAFVEGLILGAYQFRAAGNRSGGAGPVELVGASDEQALARGRETAAGTVWARDLTNTPACTKTPHWLAGRAGELAGLGVGVVVRDERWLAEAGFGGVLAVGGGSPSPPRLIHATWRPRGARADRHVVLVGKGVTFDTGGLNLKPRDGMRMMHTDMAGGAAALAAMRIIAARRMPVRVSVLVPVAENTVSGSAMRPGDVVRHVGGRTTEVTNTDAEGRLLLADALAYAAARLRPTVLVDIATLTGAMKVALGLRTGGVFASDGPLADALVSAGHAAGEPLWPLPLAAEYSAALRSQVADANNSPGNPGAITAALFLQPFTRALPWAHLDIAGPARAPRDDGMFSHGATGFGARLLASWVESLQ